MAARLGATDIALPCEVSNDGLNSPRTGALCWRPSSGGMAYVGGCNSPTSQPTSPDFIGSEAITIFST
jgi:hypothetical protein